MDFSSFSLLIITFMPLVFVAKSGRWRQKKTRTEIKFSFMTKWFNAMEIVKKGKHLHETWIEIQDGAKEGRVGMRTSDGLESMFNLKFKKAFSRVPRTFRYEKFFVGEEKVNKCIAAFSIFSHHSQKFRNRIMEFMLRNIYKFKHARENWVSFFFPFLSALKSQTRPNWHLHIFIEVTVNLLMHKMFSFIFLLFLYKFFLSHFNMKF